MKLLPILASAFAFQFSSVHLNEVVNQLQVDIKSNKFELLDLCHHYTSGMKAIFTQMSYESLLLIRQCIGGAGYSAWSGIPNLIEKFSPIVTLEGDNTVMAQQSCNYIMKQT